MDGNGRWAQKRGLPRQLGHEQGAKTVEDIIVYASELKIPYITLYAFSSENWQRPKTEVDAVMKILESYLKKDSEELIKNDIKIAAIGSLEKLPRYLQDALGEVIAKTAHCKKLVITLALSYGAWEELVSAVKMIINEKVSANDVDEELIRQHLYTNALPDPDLLIRTGEMRLSNFLLLQLRYSELYFCPTLWPDFQRRDFDLALKSYCARDRRFGSLNSRA